MVIARIIGVWIILVFQKVGSQLLDLDDLVQNGCQCEAVDNNDNIIMHNFGVIQACNELLECGCGREARSCRRLCEGVVREWAGNNCPNTVRGTRIRARFRGRECNRGDVGDNIHNCEGQQCLCGCNVAAAANAAALINGLGLGADNGAVDLDQLGQIGAAGLLNGDRVLDNIDRRLDNMNGN